MPAEPPALLSVPNQASLSSGPFQIAEESTAGRQKLAKRRHMSTSVPMTAFSKSRTWTMSSAYLPWILWNMANWTTTSMSTRTSHAKTSGFCGYQTMPKVCNYSMRGESSIVISNRGVLLGADLHVRVMDFAFHFTNGYISNGCIGGGSRRQEAWRRSYKKPPLGIRSVRSRLDSRHGHGGPPAIRRIRKQRVQPRYKDEQFPDATDVACGGLIPLCWKLEAKSADQVLQAIEASG